MRKPTRALAALTATALLSVTLATPADAAPPGAAPPGAVYPGASSGADPVPRCPTPPSVPTTLPPLSDAKLSAAIAPTG
jgi:hypothetical protein